MFSIANTESSAAVVTSLVFIIIGWLCRNVNGGWDESSVVHSIPTVYIKLFTLLIIDWTLLYWCTGRFIW